MKVNACITCLAILMYSCDDNECGEDINLGTLELTETTQQFIPYTGEEVLTFEDDQGDKHILRSTDGRQLSDSKLVTNTLCRGCSGKFNLDSQVEFYQAQNERMVLHDQLGNQIFYIDLMIGYEESNQTDPVALYDLLSVYLSVREYTFGNINIITSERQGEITTAWRDIITNNTTFVGDTTLYGREFKKVYKSSSLEET